MKLHSTLYATMIVLTASSVSHAMHRAIYNIAQSRQQAQAYRAREVQIEINQRIINEKRIQQPQEVKQVKASEPQQETG